MHFSYLLTLAAVSDVSYALLGPKPLITTHGRFPDTGSQLQNKQRKRGSIPAQRRQDSAAGSCASSATIPVTAPKTNIWAGLSNEETASVVAFLHDQQELNLTVAALATPWDNKIILVELLLPNKSDALTYLDKSGAAPDRYARAQLKFGATEEPYIQEYVVGPLPVPNGPAYDVPGVNATTLNSTQPSAGGNGGAAGGGAAGGSASGAAGGTGASGGGGGGAMPRKRQYLNETTGTNAKLAELNWPYNKGKGYQRVYTQDQAAVAAWTYEISASIQDLTMLLFNGTALGLPNDTYALAANTPLVHDGDKIYQWNQFYQIHTGGCFDEVILPTGLIFQTDITGRDPSKWAPTVWQYNGVLYDNLDALKAAANAPGFFNPGPNVDGIWACTDHNNETFPHDELNPPVSVQPDGNRYALDEEEQYVEWMDFSFYIASSRDHGVRLHEIRYQGERIIYELGIEEAMAHYASASDPFQAANAYTDLEYGFGASSFQLVSGFDCPAYATFLNTTFNGGESSHIHPSSLCIFEYDPGYPIQRHTAPTYVSVSKNIFLTVRSAATVGNYDYMFDYEFYLDGSMKVTVKASGYIQSSYWPSTGAPQDGFHIHDNLAGSMHEHVLQFKLDLDVAGQSNSLMSNELVPVSEVYPWSKGKKINTMTFKRGQITNEDDSSIDWDSNLNKMYSIVNKDAKNAFGEYRGYKLIPGAAQHNRLTIEDSTTLGPTANWARNNFYVVKRKDSEPHSVYAYNSYDPFDPVIDFAKFLDGESIDQEDLVVFFNLGMHHVPDTSDLPNTVYTASQSSMIIQPQNYLNGDPSRNSIHGTRINAQAGVVTDALTFGTKYPTCSVDLKTTQPELKTWVGEVYTGKYPFLPDSQMIGNPGEGLAAALS